MGLEGLELSCQHFVVGITADEHDIVKFPEKGHFVSVKCEPGVNPFFDHSSGRIGAQMLIVEDDIVLYQRVLEQPLFEK